MRAAPDLVEIVGNEAFALKSLTISFNAYLSFVAVASKSVPVLNAILAIKGVIVVVNDKGKRVELNVVRTGFKAAADQVLSPPQHPGAEALRP